LEIDISCGYLRTGERDEGEEMRADLEGSTEDAEFDKGHGWFRGEGIGAGNPSWIEHYIVHSTR
jgi:hypothetical protein